jgi:hypothetical protein
MSEINLQTLGARRKITQVVAGIFRSTHRIEPQLGLLRLA